MTSPVAAALATATSLGLTADEAIVLQASNKVTMRLLPCDVLARVAPAADQELEFEIALAARLSGVGQPDPRVAPRVYALDSYAMTFWTYYPPLGSPSTGDYAGALSALHEEMRSVDFPVPHFTARIGHALDLLADRSRTPDLPAADREVLVGTLEAFDSRGAAEQLLHGEPHPGNLLNTRSGLLFIDLETCCRGPVEFDVAHAPVEVGAVYPGLDRGLLRDCRLLMLAIITTWRWDRDDRLPDGLRKGREWLAEIRASR